MLAVFAFECRPSLYHAPVNVSQTCRIWREIATNEPQLWAHLRLNDTYEGKGLEGYGCEKKLQILRLWLNRSRQSTLSYDVNETTSLHEPALQLLVEHQNRWKHVKVNLGNGNRAQRIPITSLPHLESFEVEIDWNGDLFRSYRVKVDLFPEFGGPLFLFPPTSSPDQVIAPRLTTLRVEAKETDNKFSRLFCLPMLRHCPNLLKLSIFYYPWEDEQDRDSVDETEVYLPKLQEFEFVTKYDSHTHALSFLRLPELKKFGISIWSVDPLEAGDESGKDVLKMIQGSNMRLQVLDLDWEMETGEHEPEVLRCVMGSLESCSGISLRSLLTLFTSARIPNSVFPLLQNLSISDFEVSSDALGRLMDTLIRLPRFHFLKVYERSQYLQDERLKAFVEEGRIVWRDN